MELPQSLVHELPKHWTSATQGPATGHANEGKGPFHLDPRRRAGGCRQTSAITFLAKHISASLSLWEPLAPTRSGDRSRIATFTLPLAVKKLKCGALYGYNCNQPVPVQCLCQEYGIRLNHSGEGHFGSS